MDAPKRLLLLCSNENGNITRYHERLRMLDNGMEHYFVEVTCQDGIQYGLQAWGRVNSTVQGNNEGSWKGHLIKDKKICKFFIYPYHHHHFLLLILEI
jgi:hypothetical protein